MDRHHNREICIKYLWHSTGAELKFETSAKPAIRRSGVSAERRKLLEIEEFGFRPGVLIGYSPEGFLPKAAALLLPSFYLYIGVWLLANTVGFGVAAPTALISRLSKQAVFRVLKSPVIRPAMPRE